MAVSGNYYTYLASSLPMLRFGAKSPVTFEKFLSLLEGLIPEDEIEELRRSKDAGARPDDSVNPTLRKWRSFDRALRNELVKIRAPRLKIDPEKYLEEDGFDGLTGITHIALGVHRQPSLLESERFLDAARWHYLDSLEAGHYFDFDLLAVYAEKLLILEKWDKIGRADTHKVVSDLLEPVETA